MNYMKQVAKMLGLELDEEFCLTDGILKHRISKEGIQWYYTVDGTWNDDDENTLAEILSGRLTIESKPWRPELGETYYRVGVMDENVTIFSRSYDGDIYDAESMVLENCFKSEDEAERHQDEVIKRAQKILDGKLRVEFRECE